MINSNPLISILKYLTATNRFVIGYSGGLDSHVLLHALATLFQEHNYLNRLHVIHINHGLSVNADEWSKHCTTVCQQLKISCEIISLNAKSSRGESPEAIARTLRYAALAKQLATGDYLLTAHHQDDQAETLLLQLFRGAGLKGLASMPELASFAKGYHLRPLLHFTRADLNAYARKYDLCWVDDESNSDVRYDRNYVRQTLIPHIKQRWPSFAKTLARTAQNCAEGQNLLEILAGQDLQNSQGEIAKTLSISRLKKFEQRALL